MHDLHSDWLIPDWPCPPNVRALVTSRTGGVSAGSYASLNLGMNVGDNATNVIENRQRLNRCLPHEPNWLTQVHGNTVVAADTFPDLAEADAIHTTQVDRICAVMVADCLPVLFCNQDGTAVAAAHAGWRGLCAGVLENTVKAMRIPGESLLAYLGPAIGPRAFEVGKDVIDAFVSRDAKAQDAFRPHGESKWLADIFLLARQRLQSVGVNKVYGGTLCTVSNPGRFFSHRRDKVSGRMAALIWLAGS